MQAAAFHNLGQPKVNDLQLRVIILAHKEEVFWLQITVHNVHVVTIIEGLEDLAEDFARFLLAEEFFLDNPIEKLASFTESLSKVKVKLDNKRNKIITYSVTKYTFFLSSKYSYSLITLGWSSVCNIFTSA